MAVVGGSVQLWQHVCIVTTQILTEKKRKKKKATERWGSGSRRGKRGWWRGEQHVPLALLASLPLNASQMFVLLFMRLPPLTWFKTTNNVQELVPRFSPRPLGVPALPFILFSLSSLGASSSPQTAPPRTLLHPYVVMSPCCVFSRMWVLYSSSNVFHISPPASERDSAPKQMGSYTTPLQCKCLTMYFADARSECFLKGRTYNFHPHFLSVEALVTLSAPHNPSRVSQREISIQCQNNGGSFNLAWMQLLCSRLQLILRL